jgi:transaldolase
MNPLRQLEETGQAVWLDYIRRDLLRDGELARLVEEDGITGVTSNPAIFQKAIGESELYDEQLSAALRENPEATALDLYEAIAITDIRMAADVLRSPWEATGGADGFVSLEVSPHLARDTNGTVEEARRLWAAVDRPNLMIKVPATAQGIPAIETLLAEEINVNVTLMFSQADYEAVAHAYLRGVAAAATPRSVSSVASFFVSRVDSKLDDRLEAVGSDEALALRGRIGIDNSKLAYRRYQQLFEGEAFAPLAAGGARVQRVLWASTSTKNPAYRDVLYVEELIGPRTVDTLPPETLTAFRDHGRVRPSLLDDVEGARRRIASLAEMGIDLDRATAELQEEGITKFAEPFDRLIATLESKRAALLAA